MIIKKIIYGCCATLFLCVIALISFIDMIRKFAILLVGAFFIMMMMIMFSGCVTQKRCNAKFPPAVEIHTEHIKETIVKDSLMPGATVYNTVFKDSIAYYPAYQWKVIKDTSGLTELRVMRDAYGNLMMQCETKDRLATRMEVLESKINSEKKIVVKTEKQTPWYNLVLITALILFCIYLRFFRR